MESRICPGKIETAEIKQRQMVLLLCYCGKWRGGIVVNDCTDKTNCCVNEEILPISEPEVQWKTFALQMTKKSSIAKSNSENAFKTHSIRHCAPICCQ